MLFAGDPSSTPDQSSQNVRDSREALPSLNKERNKTERDCNQKIAHDKVQKSVHHDASPSRIFRRRLISSRVNCFASIKWVIAGAREPPVSCSANDFN